MPQSNCRGKPDRAADSAANHPDLMLIDEPFGSLEAQTRMTLQKELSRIWEFIQVLAGPRQTGKITLATHVAESAGLPVHYAFFR